MLRIDWNHTQPRTRHDRSAEPSFSEDSLIAVFFVFLTRELFFAFQRLTG